LKDDESPQVDDKKDMFSFTPHKHSNKLAGDERVVTSLGSYPDGSTMVIGQEDGSIAFVDQDNFKKKFEFQENLISGFVYSISGGWDNAANDLIK
jgi:hypothetical protein